MIYEFAFRRYEDPLYLSIIAKARRSLSLSVHSAPPSVLYDLYTEPGPASVRKPESVNFYDNGIGVLRVQAGKGVNQLILLSGESRSHGHPDKLTIDVFGQGDVLLPDPGVISYQDPLDPRWYDTTLASCTLTVDEKSQIYYGNLYKYKGMTAPVAPQLVFGPAATMGIQRAFTSTCYPGVTMDRSVFLTPEYVADIFGAFSDGPHKYDLAWHLRGEFASDLPFQPMTFPGPVADGYNALSGVRHATTGETWSATATRNSNEVRLFAAGGTETEVITGTGHYRGGIGFGAKDEFPPAILERRANISSTLYGNAVDISGTENGYLKGVSQEGGTEMGYGLLKLQTIKGTDFCFAAYRPGTYTTSALSTDALQALVVMDGTSVQAMYLGGGKTLQVPGGSISRSEPGLAYVEATKKGQFTVGNPSPTAATITVTLPQLSGSKEFLLDNEGNRTGRPILRNSSTASFDVKLEANSRAEFSHE